MAIENYWETEQDYPDWYDSGGTPVGDPVGPSAPVDAAPRERPPKPTTPPMNGTEWVFDEQYWTWVTKPVAGYTGGETTTPTGPRPGDRRQSPRGPEYFEEWNGSTWVTYDTPGSTGGGGTGTGGGGTGGASMGAVGDMIFDPTTIQNVGPAPAFNAPRYQSPGKFSWEKPGPFKAPDAQAVFEDPGFQTRLDLGKKAIENSASARGASRAGATYKGLIDYAETMGSQEYGQVYGRRASEYDRTYRNAFEDAVTGYGFLLSDADKRFQNDLAASSAEYQPEYATWQESGSRAKAQAQLDFERERDQTNLDWSRSVFGSDDAYRNNALISSIFQTIFNAGRPTPA